MSNMLGKEGWSKEERLTFGFHSFHLKPYACLARKTKVTLQLGYVLDSTNDDSSVGWVIPRKHTLSECWVSAAAIKGFFFLSFLFNTTMAVKYPLSDWTKGFHFAEENKNLLNQNENQKMFTLDWTKYVISPQTRFLSVEISPRFSGFWVFSIDLEAELKKSSTTRVWGEVIAFMRATDITGKNRPAFRHKKVVCFFQLYQLVS